MSIDSQSNEQREQQINFANDYINANASNFDSNQIYYLKEDLMDLPVENQTTIQAIPLKNPVLALILSLFFGPLGIDRFYLGQIGLGIGKLVTLGGLGIWALVDWFLIMKATRNNNYENVSSTINDIITDF